MSITLIIGPMFSGKTTELIRLIDRKRISGKKCAIIKNKIDNRYEINYVTSHNNHKYSNCDILIYQDLSLEIANELKKKYDVIGVDEGHFFPNIDSFCGDLADNGIDVFVSALDSSFQQKLFIHIGDLISHSEIVIKLDAICMKCKTENASFNIRTIDSEEEILVGGSEIYQCVCRKCLILHTK